MTTHTFKIDHRRVRDIEDGSQTAHVVHGNDERDVTIGDHIRFEDAKTGENVTERKVLRDVEVPARDALRIIKMYGANYRITSVSGLINALNGYYDDGIAEDTKVEVIVFEPPTSSEQSNLSDLL